MTSPLTIGIVALDAGGACRALASGCPVHALKEEPRPVELISEASTLGIPP